MKKRTRGNGSGSVYKRGKTWRAEVRIMAGDVVLRRATKSGFPTKSAALACLSTLKDQLQTDPISTIPCKELFDKVMDSAWFSQLSQDKQVAYRIARKRCAPLETLSDARKAAFDAQQGIISGLTYYPARDVRTFLNKAWEVAERDGCLEKNLAPLLVLPKLEKQKSKTIFTEEQLRQIEECSHPFRDYVLLMIYMGLRPIELRELRAEDVHLDEHYTEGGRKTAKGIPIAITPEADPVLRRLCEGRTGKLCRMSEDDFYDRFYACLAAAGIQDPEDHTLTPYSCRHTFVTRLTKSGAPQAIIQKAARHTSYKTTQGYTHLDLDDVLGWFRGGSSGGSRN